MPETPFSIVTSALAKYVSIKALIVVTIFVVIPLFVHYASPVRLTVILEAAMSKAKATFTNALEAGHLSYSEVDRFNTLQREVSAIKMETLGNSRSYWGSLWGFLKGRTFTVLLCIWKARDLETEMKVKMLKETRVVRLS
ncbi:hypothetical protein DFH06DRAFT_1329810 [Mycena polygramma]|nr:hypothetical protein DFH06DRAFT_1329810 [Mycena polygramma]